MRQKATYMFSWFMLGMFCTQAFMPLLMGLMMLEVKQEQQAFISKNSKDLSAFAEISISPAQFEELSSKDEKELIVDGIMYDVHSVKKQDGKFLAIVLLDEKETKMNGLNERLVKESDSKKNNVSAFLFAGLYVEQLNDLSFSLGKRDMKYFSLNIQFPDLNYKRIPIPPPDVKA